MENLKSAKINAINLSYTWEIENLNFEEQISGNKFDTNFSVDCFGMKWQLSFYPRGVNETYEKYVSLFIYLLKSSKLPVTTEATFSIVDADNKKHHKLTIISLFDKLLTGGGTFTYALTSDLIKNDLIVNNKVTITCDICAHLCNTNTLATRNLSTVQIFKNYLSQDFQKIMGDASSSDVTIVVSGQKLQAHKTILSARSSVFSALFSHEMQESITNTITIEGVEIDSFNELLRFIYTGKVKNLEKFAFELFSLADRYDLSDLKNMCEVFLYEHLTIDNVIDVYLLSDRHTAIKLKRKAFGFIVDNVKDIVGSHKFKILEKTKPSVISDILHSVVSKQAR